MKRYIVGFIAVLLSTQLWADIQPVRTIDMMSNVKASLSLKDKFVVANDECLKTFDNKSNRMLNSITYPAEIIAILSTPGFDKKIFLARAKNVNNQKMETAIIFGLTYNEKGNSKSFFANLWVCDLYSGVWRKVNKETVMDIDSSKVSTSDISNDTGKLFFIYDGKGVVVDYGQFLNA